ncbi:MAG TPA: O-antigen ligase family protein [Gaiellaceae bacterium]
MRRSDWPLAAIALASATAVAFRDGGYFPSEWGWSALALLWIAAIGLFVHDGASLSRLEWAMLGSFAAYVGWVALSALWSTSVERSVLEAQRGLIYFAALLTVFVVARGRSVAELLAAACGTAMVVSSYALGRLFFPDRFGLPSGLLNRLSEPLGYPNALGLVAAIGTLLAVAFAAHGRSRVTRASAAAGVVVFALTIFFTFSRGAWGALAVGLVAMVLLDSRRVELLRALAAVVPVAAVAFWLGSRADALTTPGGAAHDAVREGHLLALGTVLLAAAAAMLAVTAAPRFHPSRRAVTVGLVVLLAASAAAVEHYGVRPRFGHAPGGSHRRLAIAQANTSVTLSLSGRRPLWRQAWNDWKAHPALGSGAGTFELYWVRHRRTSAFVRDAHSLYLETLAELGPVGLALLVAALAVPLAGAAKARAHPLVPGASAAYLAFLVHAGIDWDWEMPAVTLLGLFCGSAVLLAARGERRPRLSGRVRAVVLAATLALVPVAFVGLIGNGALEASARAADAHRWPQAAAEARRATRWLPWSSEAWRRLGIAESEQGDPEAARSSLRKAVAKAPGEWRPWVSLMRVSTGRAQRRALREAARLDPRDPEVVQFLLAPGSLTRRPGYDDAWVGWPVAPLHRQHPIRSAFLDPRPGMLAAGGEPAYHFGIDVGVRDDRPEPGAPPGRTHRVYAIEGGYVALPAVRETGPCVNRKVEIDHFSYWHVDPVVEHGQEVRPGQMIGWTCKGLWHVHLAETMQLYGRRVYVNPIHPGMKLGPYTDDEPPRIRAIEFFRPAVPRWIAGARTAFPQAGTPFPDTAAGRDLVSGRVDVRAWIDDPESRLGPRELLSASPPYGVSLEVIRERDGRRVLARTVFQAAVFLGDSLGTQAVPIAYHYAPGTEEALPAVACLRLHARDCSGAYWFRLFARPTAAYWDTTRLADGDYRLRVTAWDAAGNRSSATAGVAIGNRRSA